MPEDSPSDPQSKVSPGRSQNSDRVKIVSAPEAIPVFNCRILVGRPPGSEKVRARVANLAGIEVESDSERAALQQIVTRFKETVSKLHAAGETIEWVDPPSAAHDFEQERLIGVHL